MNVPSLETPSFFAENSASGRTTLGAGTGGTRLSGSGEGRRFGVRVRVLALCPPTVTHPDALHHRDVLILVCLEGDPAGAGGPAHGSCFCRPQRPSPDARALQAPRAHTRVDTPEPFPRTAGARPRPQEARRRRRSSAPASSGHAPQQKCLRLVGDTNDPPLLGRGSRIGWPGPGCYGNRCCLTGLPQPLEVLGIVVFFKRWWLGRSRLRSRGQGEHGILGDVVFPIPKVSNPATFREVRFSHKTYSENIVVET